jgi:thiol-disulfide isomerase/thioredoxin
MIKYIFSLIVILFLTGCQQNEKIQNQVGLLDETSFKEALSENKGNVLVVNVWATWCVPCVEEMPDLIKLADYYENKNVKIISISIDYHEEIESKILPFIKKYNLNFPVFVNNFENDEAFINFFNTEWSGAIPATFIYDKNGIQNEFLLGRQTLNDFKQSIESHL